MNYLASLKEFLFSSPFDNKIAYKLYLSIVKQARLAIFYNHFDVCDTIRGRFDMLAMHAYLVINRLRHEEDAATNLSQSLFDLMFADIDQNLREMSYGEAGVAKRIKDMAESFYGRMKAYDEALKPKPSMMILKQALNRNLYRDTIPSEANVEAMATYFLMQYENLQSQSIKTLMKGNVIFNQPIMPSTCERQN